MHQIVTAAALGVLASSHAGADAEATFTQLTQTPFGFGMFEPSITPDGGLVAFSGAFDFTGGNPEGNFEVFLLETATGLVTQLTDTPAFVGNFRPMITPDGAHVVFRSLFDYTGGNPDGLFELFEVEVATGGVRQITDNPAGVSVFEPDMAGDGSWITYRMFGDPVGMNPEGNFEIFRVNRLTEAVEQITVTEGGQLNSEPAVNGDGSRIAFRSRVSFDGSNPNGNIEIWVWDAAAGTTAVTVTDIAQENESPDIDAEGRFVTFISRFDFTGGNPAGNEEVYVADTALGAFQQATQNGPLLHLEPVMSPDGSFIVFESPRDPLGLNPDQNRELFLFDIPGDELCQLTQTVGGVSAAQLSDRASINYAAIAADLPTLAWRFEKSIDPGVINDGGNLELFLAELPIVPPPPPPCPDVNGDDQVGSIDLNLLLAEFGGSAPPGTPPDFDGDGVVGSGDLNALLAAFGEPCP